MSKQVSFADVNTFAKIQVGRREQQEEPTTTIAIKYAMVYQHLPRCKCCGRFLKPTDPICANSKCKLMDEQQGEPKPWSPEGIKFTTDASKVGQLVSTEPPTPDLDPTGILASLDAKIRGTAYKWSSKIPDGALNADDFAQEIRVAILEKADKTPDFLKQAPSYIVAHGAWRAMDKARHQLRFNSPADDAEFEDRVWAGASDVAALPETAVILGEIWEAMDDWGRRIIEVILKGDVFFQTTRRLNVAALARVLGTDIKTIRCHLKRLRKELKARGLGFGYLRAAA
jgi:hypothetical protein